MLYRIIRNMIQKGRTDGLTEKLDILLLANRLTQEEYQNLKLEIAN